MYNFALFLTVIGVDDYCDTVYGGNAGINNQYYKVWHTIIK